MKFRNWFIAALVAAGVATPVIGSDINTSTWSETAASNNASPPNGWPEGMAPSTVNDAAREMMGALKREFNRTHPTVTSGGSANAQTLTYATAVSAYSQGLRFCFVAGFTNTGAATLNVSGLGAKNVTKLGTTALQGGEIVSGADVCVEYDGTQFQLVSAFPDLGTRQWGGTSGGSANAQTVSLTPAPGAYAAGLNFAFKAGFTNTGATTLNVSSLGTKNVFLNNAGLIGGELLVNNIYEVVYDGTQFQLAGPAGNQRPTISVQVFTGSGTYTPTTGMALAWVRLCGGGGGGGGAGTTNGASGEGGGGGGYSEELLTAATIGASQTVTIGSGGSAGTAGGGNGGNGGTTSFGALLSATGGTGGLGHTTLSATSSAAGGAGSGGDVNITGGNGQAAVPDASVGTGGIGGNCGPFGGGGIAGDSVGSVGGPGGNYGGGGGGGHRNSSSQAGGAGAGGVVIVTEFRL